MDDQIPTDPYERELWKMGFTREEREKIRTVSKQSNVNPVLVARTIYDLKIKQLADSFMREQYFS